MRKIASRFAAFVATILLFATALVASLLLHLDTAAARRVIVARTNATLAPSFAGTVTVERLDGIKLIGVRGVRARILDPDGKQVLFVDGVSLRVSAFRLLASLAGKGDVVIELPNVTADLVDASLDTDSNGTLGLQRAFAPRTTASASSAPGRDVRVAIQDLGVAHAWVHGQMAGAPPIDADADAIRGSVRIGPGTVVDVSHLALRARGLPRGANPTGDLTARYEVASSTGAESSARLSFHGTVGGVRANARAQLDGQKLDATVDIPPFDTIALRPMVPEASLSGSAEVRAEVHGVLPELDAVVKATLGIGSIDLYGHATLGTETRALATLDARAIDLRVLSPDAPESRLGATVHVLLVATAAGAVSGDVGIDVLAGSVAEQSVPPASLHGVFATTSAGPTLHAAGRVWEPGAPVDLIVDLAPRGGSSVIDVDAWGSVPNLGAVARLGDREMHGRGRLHAQAEIALGTSSLDGAAEVSVDGFARKDARVSHARVQARATGALAAPMLDATAAASGLEVGGRKFSGAQVTIHGQARAPSVTLALDGVDAPSVRARVDVETVPAIALRALQARVWRDSTAVTVSSDLVQLPPGGVVIEDAALYGLGYPAHVALHATPSVVGLRAHSDGLDVGRLASILRMEKTVRSGVAAFDVDVVVEGRAARGKLVADLTHVSAWRIDDANAHLDGALAGRSISATLHAAAGAIGRLDVKTENLEIAGTGKLGFDSWKKAWGAVDMSTHCDLAKVAALIPPESLPMNQVSGMLDLSVRFERDSLADLTPEVILSLATRGLVIESSPQTYPPPVAGSLLAEPGFRMAGVDAKVDLRIDGDTGRTALDAHLVDQAGDIIGVSAKTEPIAFGELMASSPGSMERLLATRVSAKAMVPRRALDKFHKLVDLGIRGDIQAMASVEGTLQAPKAELSATLSEIVAPGVPKRMHLGANVLAHYAGERGDLDVRLGSPQAEMLTAGARIDIKVADLLSKSGQALAWGGSARAHASGFPIGVLSALANVPIHGSLNGDVSVDDLHRDARARIDLNASDLRVGDVRGVRAKMSCTVGAGSLRASARVDQSDGFVDVSANAGVKWGSALAPSLDDAKAVDAALKASRFRVGVLLPFVQTAFSQLDGRLDADAHVNVAGGGASPQMQGAVAFRDGVVQLTSMDEELHGVTAKVTLDSSGTARLDDLVAHGVTGKLTASGVAHFAGVHFVDATGSVRIAKKDAIPLGLNGTALGNLYGTFDMKAQSPPDGRSIKIAVEVPVMHLHLPNATTHSVQDLDAPPSVHVGTYRDAGRFVLLPVDGDAIAKQEAATSPSASTELLVNVHLGNDVQIERGTGMKIVLAGATSIRVTDKARVSGQIRLVRGSIDVQGKRFDIDKGTVSFVGDDPSNPEVVVTAGWTAPDGTRVLADFVGPVKTGKVTLHSSPPRPSNEILALILFGTTDGQSGSPAPGGAAAGVAGGVLAEGLTKGLDQLTGLQLTAKMDTTHSTDARPEVELQIARTVSLQVEIVLGVPPPGTNQDRTYVTLDWRFLRNWSLETTFGDMGSSIGDVVWQHRY